MKQILFTLLTATSFLTNSFAASALSSVEHLLTNPEHMATSLLSRFASHPTGEGISIDEVKKAIDDGGAYIGNDRFNSPIHASAEGHKLELFKPFLAICIEKDPNILESREKGGSTLLHLAACNPDVRVAEYLIMLGLETNLEAVHYRHSRFVQIVFPLFYGILNHSSQSFHKLLSQGLTSEQIQETYEQVKIYKKVTTRQ